MGLTIINASNIFLKDEKGKVRMAQEDSHDMAALTPNGDVFVVCDGMGGHVGGRTASSIAVKCIIEHLKKERYANPSQALDGALQFANMQILGRAADQPELKGMGTTACILLLRSDEAFIAHIGDSRIYLYLGKEKQLYRITKDHSYVQTLIDAGEITDEEAESHPNKNRILKALGINPELKPSISVRSILPKNGDVFLICSDGLNSMISDNTIRDVLSTDITIEQKGESLIDLAMEEGGTDNITVELIQISNSPHKRSVFRSYSPGPPPPPPPPGILTGILKWIAATALLLAIGFSGLYFYGNSIRNKAILKLRTNLENSQHNVDSLKKEVIPAIETDYDRATETMKKSKIVYSDSPIPDNRAIYERDSSASVKTYTLLQKSFRELSQAELAHTNLEERFKADSTQLADQDWYKFLKINNKNESHNDRQREEQ
jgi:serine/threonine protein phosphatase PrpC